MSRANPFPTVEDIVSNRARREPEQAALGWHTRTITLGRLAELAELGASSMAALVAPGSTVGLVMSNTPSVVGTILAIWRAGCIVVPIDPGTDERELGRRLAHSAVDAVIAHEEHVELVERSLQEAGRRAAVLISRGLRLLTRHRGARGKRGAAGDPSVAFHAYTTLADGTAQAAVLTHGSVVASALRVSASRGDGSDEVALSTHPQWDVSALVFETLSRLINGGSVVMLSRREPEALLELVEEHRATFLSLAPDVHSALAERRRIPRASVRSVTKLCVREPALSLTALRGLADRFPDAELIRSYGGVETTDGILMARHGAVFRKPDTLGKPHPGILVEVRGANGKPARPGQPGEIVCRGAVVMRGYHRAPRATREALREGWFHGGDQGYIDAEGEIQLVRRGERRAARPEPTR